jgi:hypothetical protein
MIMLKALHDPGLNLVTGLSDVELTTLTGDAVYSLRLQSYDNLEIFLGRKHTALMLCQDLHPANVVKVIEAER